MPVLTLTVMNGKLKGQEFVLEGPGEFIVGRAADCAVPLAHADASQLISRHHCLLTIDPPAIRVRDLGSRHGTCVNGRSICQRQRQQRPEAAASALAECEVHEGDEIEVVITVLRVGVLDFAAAHRQGTGRELARNEGQERA